MKYPQLVSMPSAVSDWLEEQLEARGIDAVVYTRYVLSLLHRDTLDLIATDQDIQLPKDVRQSGRSRKRFRRSVEWWSHVRADVEQLRRSAAVECLKSASDQKCGIESLVDELCEKLKHFESSSTTETKDCCEDRADNINTEKAVLSPTDLAKRYYAAFPPLTCKSGSATNLIDLLPHLYNNNNNNSNSSSGSINKRKHCRKTYQPTNNRSTSRDTLQRKSEIDNMKSRSGTTKQQRFAYFNRTKKDFGFARSMEKSSERSDILSDWDRYFMSGGGYNRTGDEGYSTSDTTGVDESEDISEMEHSDIIGEKTASSNIDDGHLAKLVAKFDSNIENLWKKTTNAVESTNETDYHDLPLDLQLLLTSPTKQNVDDVEVLNVANKRANHNKSRPFIQCGTNITSSIWSEFTTGNDDDDNDKSLYDSISYSNLYNEALETASLYPDQILGDQFNSLSMKTSDKIIRPDQSSDISSVAENETNMFYENFSNENNNKLLSCFGGDMKLFSSLKQQQQQQQSELFTSLPWELTFPTENFTNNKKWSDAENYSYTTVDTKFTAASPLVETTAPFKRNNVVVNDNSSLITLLNHNKEISCFKEVVPKQVLGLAAFSDAPHQPPNEINNGAAENQENAAASSASSTKEEEDLLTSTRTHFRPIKQETTETCSNASQSLYADGTTFAIRSNLEHVNYKRSDSGTLYLESGFDTPKKYMEYKVKDGSAPLEDESSSSIEREFVVKFCVKQQNEKCCQTEMPQDLDEITPHSPHSPLEVPAKKRVLCDPDEFFFPGDEELLSDSVVDSVTCECSCPRTRAKLATNLEPLFKATTAEPCSLHGGVGSGNRPDSMVSEMTWKKCDKCNNNWSSVWPNAVDVWQQRDAQSLQHIWSSSEELCRSCLGMPAGSGLPTGRTLEYFKLREELSEDGEQLLSDLSSLQRVYMEQLPSAEVSCDLNESVAAVAAVNTTTAVAAICSTFDVSIGSFTGGNKERKRRHSSSQRPTETIATAVARNSWTNASCLRGEIHCLFTPPLLRPVTL